MQDELSIKTCFLLFHFLFLLHNSMGTAASMFAVPHKLRLKSKWND